MLDVYALTRRKPKKCFEFPLFVSSIRSVKKIDEQEVLEAVMEVAEKRFLSEGLHSVKMVDLAEELGMSKKTLYRVVSGKDELVERVFQRNAERLNDRVEALLADESLSFADRCRLFVRELSGHLSRIDKQTFLDMERYSPELYVRIQGLRRTVLPKLIRMLVVQGQQQGFFRKDIDLDFFCEVYLQAVLGLLRGESFVRQKHEPEVIHRKLSEIFFEGIRVLGS